MKKKASNHTKKKLGRYHSSNKTRRYLSCFLPYKYNEKKTKSSDKGGTNVYQKGLAAEQRTWIKKLIDDGSIKAKTKTSKNLYRSLCSIVHSNDINSYKRNIHTDHKNKYDPKAQAVIDEANKILIAHGIKTKNNKYSRSYKNR